MRRRSFIALLGSATASALDAHAQQGQQTARVGILLIGPTVAPKELTIVSELTRLGYAEGRNVTYEVRGVDGDLGRLPVVARALVAAKPDVIIGASEIVAVALADTTSQIPIVITVMGDPIAIGLTDSISHPSRNITGFTLSSSTLAAKRMQLLHELIPGLRKVAYLSPQVGPMSHVFEKQVTDAAKTLGLSVLSVPISTVASVSEAFQKAERENVQAVMVENHPSNVLLASHIIDECAVRDLPAIHPWNSEARAGALMSYGPAVLENHAGAARYVDRILKGAKVSQLPIEEPTQIRLTINLRTARTMKLTIPQPLLARADEVIE